MKHFFAALLMSIAALQGLAQPTNYPVASGPYTQSETAIAVASLNDQPGRLQLVGYNHNAPGEFKVGWAISTNGGGNWSTGFFLPSLTSYGFDPSVAFDNDRRAFFCFVRDPDPNHRYVSVRVSTDYGQNWSSDANGRVCPPGEGRDKPYIAVDETGGPRDGRVYVAYTNFGQGGGSAICLSYSTNHGFSFEHTTEIEGGAPLPEGALVVPYIVKKRR